MSARIVHLTGELYGIISGEVEAAWCAIRRATTKGFNIIIIEGDAWNRTWPLQKPGLSFH